MTEIQDTKVDTDDSFVACRSYTAARRFPMVFGVVLGFVLPVPVSTVQAITFVSSFLVLIVTKGLWSLLLPDRLAFLALIVVPVGLTWAVRHLRLEGRSPIKTAVGIVNLWLSPSQGVLRGATVKASSPTRVHQKVLIVPTSTAMSGEVEGSAQVDKPSPSSRRSGWSCVS